MTPPPIEDVVTAERVEVVDKRGRARVVVADDGIHLHSSNGRERASLTLTDSGPQLVMRQGRNSVLILGVMDDTAAAERTGCRFVLCDRHGRPRAGWFVADDGTVEPIHPDEAPEPVVLDPCGCHGTD